MVVHCHSSRSGMLLQALLLLQVLLLWTAVVVAQTPLQLKYNEIQMKSSHNSYERREGFFDQLVYHACRSVEIDCHTSLARGKFGVYHDAGYFQTYSSISSLDDGVRILQEFHERLPNHHVVTVWVDLKGNLDGITHKPQDFDDTISKLPLWTPADARANGESSIKAGIDANGWPFIEDLRGKFIWVITSGQDSYCKSDEECNAAKAFVATKSISSEADIGKTSYKVFYNLNSKDSAFAVKIRQAGYISRVWDTNDINNQEKWDKAVADQFHHITTDQVNFHKDTFSKTHNAYGFPFQTLTGMDVSNVLPEEGNVMHMTADTGDAWGRVDDVNFVALDEETAITTTDQWIEYTTSVSVVNSHCEEFAKAGIMLRQWTDPRFPVGTGKYFAVVRTCNELIRVQYRELAYLFSVAKPLSESPVRRKNVTLDGIENAKRVSFKVRVRYDGQNNITQAEGYFKREGTDRYVLIERKTFPNVRFTLHGLFTSSHYWDGNADDTPYKALFVDTKRNNETLVASNFTQRYGRDDFEFGDGFGSAKSSRRAATSSLLRG